jgi:chemotaxis-related protein WspD
MSQPGDDDDKGGGEDGVSDEGLTQVVRPGDPECWKAIGVTGDGSCPELATYTHCRNCPVFAGAGRDLLERPAPEGYREEWTTLLARAKPGAPSPISVLVFRIGPEWLAVDTQLVAEVTETRPTLRVPHRPSRTLPGLVNIRGELQLCASLHGLLGLAPSGASGARRLVLIERGREGWAVVVDEVHGVQRFDDAELTDAPLTVAQGLAPLTRGVFRWGERTVGWLGADALMTTLRRSLG